MRTLVITNCTNRKRSSSADIVEARSLIHGSVRQVVGKWIKRLSHQPLPNMAIDTYCGRGFCEAMRTAEILNATFMVASAGLGLVRSDTYIPRYNATVTVSSEDNVLSKLSNGSAQAWWDELNITSPFATTFCTKKFDLVLIGVAKPYFALLQPFLEALPDSERKKIRLFLRAPASNLPVKLQKSLMPYDARFDSPLGPVPGTQSDFPQRAMRHFSEIIVGLNTYRDSTSHAQIVEKHLSTLIIPARPQRQRLSDNEVVQLLNKHWDSAGGLSARMLRLLRDDLQVACEQKRFQSLFNAVKAQRILAVQL